MEGYPEKLQLKTNVATIVQLKYPEPKVVESKFGASYLYGVKENGIDKSWFATIAMHNKVKALKAGKDDFIKIIKKETGDNRKTTEITMADDTPFGNAPTIKNSAPGETKRSETVYSATEEKVDWRGKDLQILGSSIAKSLIEAGYEPGPRSDTAFRYWIAKIVGVKFLTDKQIIEAK